MTVTKIEDAIFNFVGVCMGIAMLAIAVMIGCLVYLEFSDAPAQSKCVEQTKARIYEWDGTTQMMYDENC